MDQGIQNQGTSAKIYDRVPTRARSMRTVYDTLVEGSWSTHIGPEMDGASLEEYLSLWMCLANVELYMGAVDTIRWAWKMIGEFFVRSTYTAKFAGREVALYAEFAWGQERHNSVIYLHGLPCGTTVGSRTTYGGEACHTKMRAHSVINLRRPSTISSWVASSPERYGKPCGRPWVSCNTPKI